jgi:membrane dipeptidase
MFIVDAHLDLAYSAVNFNRDLRQPLAVVRQQEPDPGPRGITTVTFPELQRGGVGLIFGTLFVLPAKSAVTGLGDVVAYATPDEAHQQAMTQLDYYRRLADTGGQLRLVGDRATLEEVVASHQNEGAEPLLGIVPLMEGADPIREPEEAELWYERGLRLVGLAWDDTRYAAGAWRGSGGLTDDGQRLLELMADLGFIVDLTHLSEKASHQVMDRYEGPVVATHNNARALVPGERLLFRKQFVMKQTQGVDLHLANLGREMAWRVCWSQGQVGISWPITAGCRRRFPGGPRCPVQRGRLPADSVMVHFRSWSRSPGLCFQ